MSTKLEDALESLQAVALRLEVLAGRLEAPGDVDAADDALATVRAASARLRRIAFPPSPPAPGPHRLVAALDAFLESLDVAYVVETRLARETHDVTYRIVVEAVC
jgi:hypothetical protein